MRKITRKTLDELTKTMPVLSEKAQRCYIGGGNGSLDDPYTQREYDQMCISGTWMGGYVEGWGYTYPTVTVNGTRPDSSTSGYNPGSQSYYPGYFGNSDAWGNSGSGYWYGGASNDGYSQTNSNSNQPNTANSGIGGTYYDPLKDGIDIKNSKFLLINSSCNDALRKQLTDILNSNSILKKTLSYFEKGIQAITFSVEDLSQTGASATTRKDSKGIYNIIFSDKYVDSNGWNLANMVDNIGYDWSKVHNNMEGLVVSVVHEAIHANHYARYEDAMRVANRDPNKAVQWLLNNGYSREFVEIFFTVDGYGEWYDIAGRGMDDKMHTYMEKYDHGVINAALEEYRREHK